MGKLVQHSFFSHLVV